MSNVLERVLRIGEGRTLRRLSRYAAAVNELEDDFKSLTDDELKNETVELRERYSNGESLDDLLPEAFAAVREASKRTLGMRPFDVQLMGGAALHLGNIAEMKTGEGKTLVATLPAYLNAIASRGVHVVTVNDYLASYQSELMGRVFRALGMTTGCIISGQTPAERKEQYAADITYGTNNEFGFDYLRDNMAWDAADMVQRGHHYAIVDEVDSILIDEARTPLIISGPSSGEANRWFTEFAGLAKHLISGEDYEVDEKKRTVGVLEPGIEKVEDYLGIDNLYESANTPLISFLNNAIKASALFKRDKDYVVMNGEVLIVDEHTGRILLGRRYNEGIHQAIEAKEGVAVKAENQTLATVTLQNYFRLYDKLSGHDRNRGDRSGRVHGHLQARRGADPDEQADDPHGPVRPRLQEREGQVRAGRRGHRQAAREGPAGAGRHDQRREERVPVQAARQARRQARGAQREEPRPRGRDRRPGRPARLGHRRHEHGRPWHRHHARRQRGVPLRRRAEQAGPQPGGDAGGVRGGLGCRVRGREAEGRRGGREGRRGRRPVRARHRAARVPPHRQPAARTFRPSGRPGGEPVLPLAHRRPDAPVQLVGGGVADGPQQRAGRPGHRVARGQPRHPQRAGPGRGAQRRDPQERAEVRRRAEPPARGDLRRPPPHPRGRRPARPHPELPAGCHHRGARRAHLRGTRG